MQIVFANSLPTMEQYEKEADSKLSLCNKNLPYPGHVKENLQQNKAQAIEIDRELRVPCLFRI